jgi:hypothetical protein
MRKIIVYLLLWLVAAVILLVIDVVLAMPPWYVTNVLFAKCTYLGIIGGLLYCLRAVYLNKCVQKHWDADWEIWYYLRPIASGISGFVSCIFLKAGLLVLEADVQPEAVSFGYLAVAFIAGYNVDNFAKKLEQVASSIWGIKKSRASGNATAPEDSSGGGET